jgi:hypothetical protein
VLLYELYKFANIVCCVQNKFLEICVNSVCTLAVIITYNVRAVIAESSIKLFQSAVATMAKCEWRFNDAARLQAFLYTKRHYIEGHSGRLGRKPGIML